MSSQIFDEYFQQLTPNSVLLTPNSRLAVVLHDYYISYQQRQNLQCWTKPNIYSVSAWLENLWQRYLVTTTEVAPCLLNAAQTRALWESIVAQDTTHHLLQISQTADALKTAWELICQYEIRLDDSAFQLTDDYALCQRWMLQYQEICARENYIDSANLPSFLTQKALLGEVPLVEKILLYGFTEIIPLFEKCFRELSLPIEGRREPGRVSGRISHTDPDTEILTMARYAKAINEENPNATIGCVVLDLNQRRERVLQLFTQVFFPDRPFDIDAIHYPFNISAGKSLSSYPIIAAALSICGLITKNITREEFSSILLSPYIAKAESESAERAKLDAELRQKNIHIVDVTQLPPFRGAQRGTVIARSEATKQSSTKTFTEWAQHFNNKLAKFGWPGEKSLSSEEYQVAQAWLSVLADFSSLDKIAPPATEKMAWQQLQQIAKAHIFQPQSPKTNIQILGLLEAAAVPFDYLWVAGMNDMNWPPAPKPHPFIPKPLQRQLNMPHATAERELHFCTTILEQFQAAAKHIIFSHAESDGKIEFNPSLLLQDYPTINPASITLASYNEPAHKILESKSIEVFYDAKAPAIPTKQKITGGADILKQQAACSFRAFATHRLQARELEASTQGLNPKDRGIILHDIMQRLWGEIKTQQQLNALDEENLQTIINNAIDSSINANSPRHHQATNYLKLEKKRLTKIISQWLTIEKTRPPFEVSIREEEAKIELQGQQLSVRIDRIDTLADGRKLIIDYKTGSTNSINKWFGDRPDEPQLPLYALIDATNTAGICFAQLAAGNLTYKGISDTELGIHGIKQQDAWADKIAEWRKTVEQLATNFIAGDAAVNPKRPVETCKNCAITPLCRIYEITDPTCEDEQEVASND